MKRSYKHATGDTMTRSVEPAGDSVFAPDYPDAPLDAGLRRELQYVLGLDADGVDDWLSENGNAEARAEYHAVWGER